MRASTTLLHLVLPLLATTSVSAQSSSYVTDLQTALTNAGLSTLSAALSTLPSSLLSHLPQGNHTIFAPNNDAFSSLSASDLADVSSISAILSYHITAGLVFPNQTTAGKNSIVRTTLQGAPNVLLPGNQTQVVVVTQSGGKLTVVDPKGNFTSSANVTFQNLDIQVISNILTVPQNLSTVLATTSAAGALAAAVNTVNPNLLGGLETISGLTVFAPNTGAFTAAAALLATANTTTIGAVLSNHIINGTAVYSPLITNSASYISAGGEKLTFATNSTGTFVTSGGSTAKIVQSDIILANGVLHLIDGILLNTNSDPSAAASAVSSASSVQATQTSIDTVPLTASNTGSATSTTTGGSGSGSGAVELKTMSAWVMGIVVAGLGAILV